MVEVVVAAAARRERERGLGREEGLGKNRGGERKVKERE